MDFPIPDFRGLHARDSTILDTLEKDYPLQTKLDL
jgi:hypothetical protein